MLSQMPMLRIFGTKDSGGVRAAMSWARSCCDVGSVSVGIARAARSGAHSVPLANGSTPFAVNVIVKEII